jgi:hypothetical protein
MTSSAGIETETETEPSAPSVPRVSAVNVLGESVVTAPADPPPTALVETGRSVLAEIVTIVLVVSERIDPRDAMTSQTKERGNDAPSAPRHLVPRAKPEKNVQGCGQMTASSTETKKGESALVRAASPLSRPSAAKARTRERTSHTLGLNCS